MKWTLPKKWKVVSAEVFDDADKTKDPRLAKVFVVFLVDFYEKKHWWSKETVFSKRVAVESLFSGRRTIESYDQFYWFPEMEPFSLELYSPTDYFLFGSVSSWALASDFKKDLVNKANTALTQASNSWEKIISFYEDNGEIKVDRPKYKETKSAYR